MLKRLLQFVLVFSCALCAAQNGAINVSPGGVITIGPATGITLGGDVCGSTTVPQICGLKGQPLPALAAGYLHWNGSAWVYDNPQSVFTPAGDLSGGSSSQEVIGILGQPLPPLASGYPHWNGTNWVFDTPPGIFSAAGDLSGTASSQTVVGIRGAGVPAPTAGYLHFNGTSFVFDTPPSAFTAAGDLSGSGSSQTVIGVQGHALPTLAAGYPYFNGTAWLYQTSTVNGHSLSGNVTLGFTDIATGALVFPTGLGAISQIEGPTDNPFQIASQNGQNINLLPSGNGQVTIAGTNIAYYPSAYTDCAKFTGTPLSILNQCNVSVILDGGGVMNTATLGTITPKFTGQVNVSELPYPTVTAASGGSLISGDQYLVTYALVGPLGTTPWSQEATYTASGSNLSFTVAPPTYYGAGTPNAATQYEVAVENFTSLGTHWSETICGTTSISSPTTVSALTGCSGAISKSNQNGGVVLQWPYSGFAASTAGDWTWTGNVGTDPVTANGNCAIKVFDQGGLWQAGAGEGRPFNISTDGTLTASSLVCSDDNPKNPSNYAHIQGVSANLLASGGDNLSGPVCDFHNYADTSYLWNIHCGAHTTTGSAVAGLRFYSNCCGATAGNIDVEEGTNLAPGLVLGKTGTIMGSFSIYGLSVDHNGALTVSSSVSASITGSTATFTGTFTTTGIIPGFTITGSSFSTPATGTYNQTYTVVTVSGTTITATANGTAPTGTATGGTLTFVYPLILGQGQLNNVLLHNVYEECNGVIGGDLVSLASDGNTQGPFEIDGIKNGAGCQNSAGWVTNVGPHTITSLTVKNINAGNYSQIFQYQPWGMQIVQPSTQTNPGDIHFNSLYASHSFNAPFVTTLGNFPSCTSVNEDAQMTATNCTGSSCSAGGTCTTGGTFHCQMYCSASGSWLETGLH